MKCLFVMPGMDFGGAERVISILSGEWCGKGHEVKILLTKTPAKSSYGLDSRVELLSCCEEGKQSGIPHAGTVKAIRSYCKSWKPDVVLSLCSGVAGLTAIALTGLDIPFIYSERNDPNRKDPRMLYKILRKIVENRATRYVFQTTGAQECYPQKVRAKSVVIMNPLDTKGFPVHNFGTERKEIVTVGRLEPQKNQKLLIDGFSLIKENFPDYTLTIYGEGSLRKELEAYAEEKGLRDSVLLPGTKSGIQEYIKDASLFVLTSDYEGVPNALIEAMAIGLPCVSTDCSPGGARELIHSGENGVIVKCGDPKALADAMTALLEDRDLAAKMGRNARKISQRVEKGLVSEAWLELMEKCQRK